MPQDLTDDKSTLVQVMAWCRQAISHYLSQCWIRSVLPYGVTRPQWVNHYQAQENMTNHHHVYFFLRCIAYFCIYWWDYSLNVLSIFGCFHIEMFSITFWLIPFSIGISIIFMCQWFILIAICLGWLQIKVPISNENSISHRMIDNRELSLCCNWLSDLTYWDWDKMAAILQTISLNAFSWWKFLYFY